MRSISLKSKSNQPNKNEYLVLVQTHFFRARIFRPWPPLRFSRTPFQRKTRPSFKTKTVKLPNRSSIYHKVAKFPSKIYRKNWKSQFRDRDAFSRFHDDRANNVIVQPKLICSELIFVDLKLHQL